MKSRVNELCFGDMNELEEEELLMPPILNQSSDVEVERDSCEPPSKKRREDGETSRFRQLGVKYKVTEDCDENVDEELAAMKNELFMEGLKDDFFNELLKKFLYGDDVAKSVKEIQDVNRISNKVHGKFHIGNFRAGSSFRARGRPFGRGSMRARTQRTNSNWGRWSNNSNAKDNEKKDCNIQTITTVDESEESSGDEVPLGKRIPEKKSFGTEFATDSSKTSCEF
uniref:Uncharacterized protein n=1 Tax=Magallana gigas TaxID=29159 RepID=A0A8W8NZG4_MAGGI